MSRTLEPTERPGSTGVPAAAWIGRRARRLEDERLLRGLGCFVDDIELPGTLEMAVGRCPYPHARIRGIDVSAALLVRGVVSILTGGQVRQRTAPILVLRPDPDAPELDYYALAGPLARFEGEPVVSVVAVNRYVAEDALERIDVDYEPLPHVTDAEAALEPRAPRLHAGLASNLLVRNVRTTGSPDEAFQNADVTVEGRFEINRVTGLPLEGRAVLAHWGPGRATLTVWSSTQVPHLLRMQLAHSLRLPEADIQVVAPDVGGGFGLKLGGYPEDVLACLHSMDAGRPVKWVEDRLEHFRAATHARESVHQAGIAARADGSIVAMRNLALVDAGAYTSPFGAPRLTNRMFPGPYRFEHCRLERRVALTNKTPVGAYRGYGQPESNFVREVLIDRLARKLGLDPVDVRRRNLLAPTELPWESPSGVTYDGGDYRRCLEIAVEAIGYDRIRRVQPERRARGEYVGVGVSCYVEKAGYPGSAGLGRDGGRFGAYESVTIRFNRTGRVDLYTGVSSIGQSTETAYAQVCAELLGLSYRDVRLHMGSTVGTPESVGSFSSRTIIAGAGAIEKAAAELRAKLLRIGAHLLGTRPDNVALGAGAVYRTGDPAASMPLARIAAEALSGHRLPPGESPGLEATAYYDPVAQVFGYGTAAAVVRVDIRTGRFDLDDFVFAHDCGRQVNPMIVEGQVRGGIAQALGAALFEEIVYDGETGQMVNGSMVDYFVPTTADVPRMRLDHVETPSPVTPFGVRGVGESGTIPPAAAIANAVCDALAPFGVEISRLPLTPEAVWARLHRESPARRTP
jgi:aerobic carbon-monoxide dehydrogenase large subunit